MKKQLLSRANVPEITLLTEHAAEVYDAFLDRNTVTGERKVQSIHERR